MARRAAGVTCGLQSAVMRDFEKNAEFVPVGHMGGLRFTQCYRYTMSFLLPHDDYDAKTEEHNLMS